MRGRREATPFQRMIPDLWPLQTNGLALGPHRPVSLAAQRSPLFSRGKHSPLVRSPPPSGSRSHPHRHGHPRDRRGLRRAAKGSPHPPPPPWGTPGLVAILWGLPSLTSPFQLLRCDNRLSRFVQYVF